MLKTIDEVLHHLDRQQITICNCADCKLLRDAAKAIRAQNDMIHQLQQNLADSHFPAPLPITVDEDDIPF